MKKCLCFTLSINASKIYFERKKNSLEKKDVFHSSPSLFYPLLSSSSNTRVLYALKVSKRANKMFYEKFTAFFIHHTFARVRIYLEDDSFISLNILWADVLEKRMGRWKKQSRFKSHKSCHTSVHTCSSTHYRRYFLQSFYTCKQIFQQISLCESREKLRTLTKLAVNKRGMKQGIKKREGFWCKLVIR